MRILGLLLLAGVFMVMPMMLLNRVVMPQLDALKYTYSHLDETAARVVE
jgi:hypothetical protein